MVENVYNSRERLGELDLQSTASQQSDGCILLYMAIAGALFDVTRPALASAVEMYVDPSMCQFRPLTLAANGGALLLGLVLSSLKKLSQSVLYPVLGAVFAAVGVVIFTFVEASIISLVWHGAMGAVTVTVFLGRDFVAQTQRLSERIEVGDDLVQHLRDDTWRVLRLTAQFLVAFGAALCKLSCVTRPGR